MNYANDNKSAAMTLLKLLAWIAFAAFLVGYFFTLMPEAMQAETTNQRAIAGHRHHVGYSEYAAVVRANP